MSATVPSDWTLEYLYPPSEKDFRITHVPCTGVYEGGADTAQNAEKMINNNISKHECSV